MAMMTRIQMMKSTSEVVAFYDIPNRFEFLVRGYSCTYRSSIVGSMQVIDLRVEFDYMKVLVSPYQRDICTSGIHFMSLIE